MDGVAKARLQFEAQNHDLLRYPLSLTARIRRNLTDSLFAALRPIGVLREHFSSESLNKQLDYIFAHEASWQEAYDLLDDHSSKLLLDVLLFRLLGPRHVRLVRNNTEYWNQQRLAKSYAQPGRINSVGCTTDLCTYKVPLNGQEVELSCHVLHVLNTFVLEQYACTRLNPKAIACHGDVVIDGGGCWGDSALYFAAKVGSEGRVYSFEFEDSNAALLRQNLASNPKLAATITVVQRALWNISDQPVSHMAHGPSARVDPNGPKSSISTISIDDFVRQQGIDRIDLIKMDIEGAEYSALVGAAESIRRFRPKLAISAYHSIDDLYRLLLYINQLNLGYSFALDHYTIHSEETILFATAS
jgi:FkbM family methyltransferase